MKIALIAHPFGEKTPTGLGTSTLKTVEALIQEFPEIQFEVFVKGKKDDTPVFAGSNWRVTELPNVRFWLDRCLPRKSDHDAFLFISTPVMPITFTPKNAVVITRDYGYITLPKQNIKHWFQNKMISLIQGSAMKRAKKVIAISESTKRETTQFFDIDPKKITVNYNGLAQLTEVEEEKVDVDEPFFLFLGGIKERKNLILAIKAFARFKNKVENDMNFVIAGPTGGSYQKSLVETAEECDVAESVQFPGYCDESKGAYLYRRASAFIFPTLLEGFGKPSIEAMSFGVPVITSDEPPLNEITGGAACLIDPRSEQELADAMEKIVSDKEYVEKLKDKGLKHSKKFTWQNNVKTVMLVIQEAINSK